MINDNKINLKDYYPYFKMLYNVNDALTKLKQNNVSSSIYENEELFYTITSELMRLLPYKRRREDGELALDEKSGILLLSYKKDYFKDRYNKIISFDSFSKVLNDVLTIRNKYIHQPHNISCAFSVGGTSNCSMGLYYKSRLLSISTISLMPVVYYLNKTFNYIKKEIIDNADDLRNFHNYDEFMQLDFSEDKWHYTILPEYLMFDFNK